MDGIERNKTEKDRAGESGAKESGSKLSRNIAQAGGSKFRRSIAISFLCGAGVLVLMGVLLLWRYDFVMYDTLTFLSDVFALGGLFFIIIFLIVLLSRTTFFARFGYLAQKRTAKRHKKTPEFRTLRDYMDARDDIHFDTRLLWIPGLSFFVIAVVLAAIVVAAG